MLRRRQLACSFCGRGADQVRKLVAGPKRVYICDECAALSSRIMEEQGPPPAPHPGRPVVRP